MRRGFRLGVALTSAALLCACTPSDPPAQSPTPVPSPTFSCSTSTVSDPCTGEKSQKEKEQAAAVAGATTSYEGFLAEFNRVTKVGGADQATAAMSRYAAGPYLKAYVGFIKDIKSAKERYSGDVVSRRFVLSGGESRTDAPNDMVFNFCQDGLQNKVYDASGNVIDHGSVISGKMYVRQVAGSWKLWDTTDSQGTKC